jgi:hypothetical protein
MKRLALAGCLAGVLLAWASAARAETVSLGYKQDTSSHPAVYFLPDDLERAEWFEVRVTAEPIQPLEYHQYVSCRRGSESISLGVPDQTITPPYSTTILPTLPEPESCWISISAVTPLADDALAGTIRVEATGNGRPPPFVPPVPTPPRTPLWVTCSPPDWLKSGQTKAHGESCGKSRVIATKAWRRPAKAGNVVNVRGYACRRSQRGRSATVRCTKGTNIIKVTGKLR